MIPILHMHIHSLSGSILHVFVDEEVSAQPATAYGIFSTLRFASTKGVWNGSGFFD